VNATGLSASILAYEQVNGFQKIVGDSHGGCPRGRGLGPFLQSTKNSPNRRFPGTPGDQAVSAVYPCTVLFLSTSWSFSDHIDDVWLMPKTHSSGPSWTFCSRHVPICIVINEPRISPRNQRRIPLIALMAGFIPRLFYGIYPPLAGIKTRSAHKTDWYGSGAISAAGAGFTVLPGGNLGLIEGAARRGHADPGRSAPCTQFLPVAGLRASSFMIWARLAIWRF